MPPESAPVTTRQIRIAIRGDGLDPASEAASTAAVGATGTIGTSAIGGSSLVSASESTPFPELEPPDPDPGLLFSEKVGVLLELLEPLLDEELPESERSGGV